MSDKTGTTATVQSIDWKERVLLKLTSTKTWYLIAAVLCAIASYIGGATGVLPEWLVQLGLVCGFAGGGIYAVMTAIQNAAEAMSEASTTTTTVQASTSAAETVKKIAGVQE